MLRRADLLRWAGGRGPAIGPTMGPSLPGRCPLWGASSVCGQPGPLWVPVFHRNGVACGPPHCWPPAPLRLRLAPHAPAAGWSFIRLSAHSLRRAYGPSPARLRGSLQGLPVGLRPVGSPGRRSSLCFARPLGPVRHGSPPGSRLRRSRPGGPPAAVGLRLPWAAFAAGGRRASLFPLLQTGCDLGWALGRRNPDHHGPVFTGP